MELAKVNNGIWEKIQREVGVVESPFVGRLNKLISFKEISSHCSLSAGFDVVSLMSCGLKSLVIASILVLGRSRSPPACS